MTAIELKSILIHKISAINDVPFLKAVQTILDSKANSEVLHLSNREKAEIIESKKEIEQGLFTGYDELDQEIRAWLQEK